MSFEERPSRQPRCPLCGKSTEDSYRPFCSKRCADIDLGKWLDGSYSIPAVEPPPITDEELEALFEDESDPWGDVN